MHAVVLQVVCVLVIIAAVVFFIRWSREDYSEVKAWQIALAVFQIVLCGWFFALCVSDFLDVDIPLNYAALFMRPVLFGSLALAFAMIGISPGRACGPLRHWASRAAAVLNLRVLDLIVDSCLDHGVDALVVRVKGAVASRADHESRLRSHVVDQLGRVVVHFARRAEGQEA